MPTSSPAKNSWLHLYIPLALHQPPSPAKESLYHAVISAAAFHKAQASRDHRKQLLQEAAEYKRKAADSLRLLVDQLQAQQSIPIDNVERKALLAAAMTLTSVEVSKFVVK